MTKWHYQHLGQACGPVDQAHLAALFRNGTLPGDTLVWQDGMSAWLRANMLAEFQADIAAAGASGAGSGAPPVMGTTDAEQHKVYAMIAYLPLLFLIGLLAAPQSRFARFHANQGMILTIAIVLVELAGRILGWIPFVGWYLWRATQLLSVGCVVLIVLGMINAARGENKRLPVIGGHDLLK